MFEQTGEIIFLSRKLKGWTQEQLAEKVGVSAVAVSKWERSVTIPEIEVLCKLAYLFQVSVDTLLGREQKQLKDNVDSSEEAEQRKYELGKKLLEYCTLSKRYGWVAAWATARKEKESDFFVLALNLLATYSQKEIPIDCLKVCLRHYAEREAQTENCNMICDVLLAAEEGVGSNGLGELIASHVGKAFRKEFVIEVSEKERRTAVLEQFMEKEMQISFLEELAECDDRTIQMLLRKLDNETLIAALSGASGKVCTRFLENVSERMLYFLVVDIKKFEGSFEEMEVAQKKIWEIYEQVLC